MLGKKVIKVSECNNLISRKDKLLIAVYEVMARTHLYAVYSRVVFEIMWPVLGQNIKPNQTRLNSNCPRSGYGKGSIGLAG